MRRWFDVPLRSCIISTASAPSQVDNMDEMQQDPFMDVGYLNGGQDAPTRGRGGRGRGGPPLPMPGARYKTLLINFTMKCVIQSVLLALSDQTPA